ncbi:TetR family transcriptional regulator [Nocardia miyunensis]|uniref:TetR family transcriptional regulator n=1 Tax=Nocardia miyunensis TaxID=282684 RepID=UPI000AD03EF0|nr:TetR family transcriptional regulator [Nocardia miyunensis]
MTKRQGISRAKAGLTVDRVVATAFDVLDAGGAGRLSTRAIATELGVSMNTVLWHIRTKDRLLELMSDAIVGEVDLDDLAGENLQQAAELLHRLRRAMLNHRDGALIMSGTFARNRTP